MRKIPVTISINSQNIGSDKIMVEPHAVLLRVSQNDEVEWKGVPEDLAFTISFENKSPFNHKTFDRLHPHSGRILVSPQSGEEYFKYSVEAGGEKTDPGVIIRR